MQQKNFDRLYRRREAAQILAVSESQVLKFERDGLLHAIRPWDSRDPLFRRRGSWLGEALDRDALGTRDQH
jgi:hypothetical protein